MINRRLLFSASLVMLLGGLAAVSARDAELGTRAGPPGELGVGPLVLPVLQEGRVTHHLRLDLTLGFVDATAVRRAQALLPRLRDALIVELHGLYGLRRVREAGFDSAVVRERLLLAGEHILGTGAISSLRLAAEAERLPTT